MTNAPPVQPVKPGGAASNAPPMPRLLVGAMNSTRGDDDHADDVPPHADVAEDLDQVDAERVEQAVGDEHQQEDHEDAAAP